MSEKFVIVPEKCRVCGCTELAPCTQRDFLEDAAEPERATCSWMDFDHTLCSNLECVARVPLNELLEMPLFRFAMTRGGVAS